MNIEVSDDTIITVKHSAHSPEPRVIIYAGQVSVRGRDIAVTVDGGTIIRDGVSYDRALFISRDDFGRVTWDVSFGSVLDTDYHAGTYRTEEIPNIIRNAVLIFTDHFEN